MGTAALPLAIGGMGATSLLQFGMTRSAGKIAQMEAETAARQEEVAVVQREADRKEALARALASQNAETGAKGIMAFEGSPLSILQADIEAEKKATSRDTSMSKIAAMTTRARGNIAKRQAYTQSVINLIGDTGKMAGLTALSKA